MSAGQWLDRPSHCSGQSQGVVPGAKVSFEARQIVALGKI